MLYLKDKMYIYSNYRKIYSYKKKKNAILNKVKVTY